MRRYLAVLAFLILAAPAGAATRYASPGGTGSTCSQAAPCPLGTAVSAAVAGDEVVVGSGTYGSAASPLATLNDPAAITVRGEFVGIRRPVIYSRVNFSKSGSKLQDIEVVNPSSNSTAIVIVGGTAERIIARSTAANGNDGCFISNGSITNSVCRSRPGGSSGVTTGSGSSLRHVTALGGSFGVYNATGNGSERAVIARGDTNSDVSVGSGSPTLTNVAFNSIDGGSPTITGQIPDEPLFVAADDYRPAPTSPVIDKATLVDADVGATDLDLDGNLRKLGAHTDPGAYEYVPAKPILGAPSASQISASAATITTAVDTAGGATQTAVNYGTAPNSFPTPGATGYLLGSDAPQNQTLPLTGLAPATTYYYIVGAASDGGTAATVTGSFTTLPDAPTATTGDATNVTTTSATLPGSADLKQAMSGTARFVIGADLTPVQNVAASGPINATVNGLQPNTTYQYRAQITTTGGTGQGDIKTFTTLPLAPAATTGDATEIGATSARLAGTADTKGVQGQVSVLLDGTPLGEETRFGGAFSVVASNLAPGSTHSYQLRVITTGGTAVGDVKQFTTLPAAPAATAGDATNVTQTTATLSGTTDLDSAATGKVRFIYGADQTAEQDTTGGAASADVTGLSPNTTYAWKVRVTTTGGQGESAVKQFTTLPEAPTAATGDVTELTTTSARLGGTADTKGVQGQIAMLVDGNPVGEETRFGGPVSVVASDLTPASAHTYRLRVTTSAGTALGEERTFTTGTAPTPTPTATATPTPSATPDPDAVLGVRFRVVDAFVKRRISLQREAIVAAARCLRRSCRVAVTGAVSVNGKRIDKLAKPKPRALGIDRRGTFRIRITAALRTRLYRYLRRHPRANAFLKLTAKFTGDDGSRRTRTVRLMVLRPR